MPVRAITSFAAPGRFHVREGDLLPDDHAVVKAAPNYFEPAGTAADRRVEQATAAPGEKRTVQRDHVCDVCGKKTASKAGLSAHKRSHDDES